MTVNLVEQIINRKEQVELAKKDLENLEKDLTRLESDYVKTFQVGEKAIQKAFWSEQCVNQETEVIIAAIKYEYYLNEPRYQIYTVSAADTKNGHESMPVADLTKLTKANHCQLCETIIPQGEAFCNECNKELDEEVKSGTEGTYPCVGCGVEIPATEPYCKDCEKKMERALAA